MKIAVLGGSFNPVHIGHMALADEVCVSLGYDKVLFVPASTPPHKQMNGMTDACIRAKMVELACSDDPRFELETCEIDRGGVSYTYDTVCHLEEKYRGRLSGKIGLILGRDLLPSFHLWRKADELARRCSLILAARPHADEDKAFMNRAAGAYAECENAAENSFSAETEPLFAGAVTLANEPLAVSSTGIRARIFRKMAFQYLVPSQVFKYISDGKLYGSEC